MQMNQIPMYRTRWGAPQARYKPPSKVVSIPVHFVGSERSRSDSATKIQKMIRGFLVRSSVKKMKAVEVELEEIEKKVCDSETVELMRKEERERVKVSETIMNLLLKLDSVRVLQYSALRDCRKTLIKKAIALQELVDQVAMVDPSLQDQPPKEDSASSEMNEGVKIESLGNEEENLLVKEEQGQGEKQDEVAKMEALGNEGENCLVKEEMGQVEKQEEDPKMETSGNEEENCLEKEEEGQDEKHEEGPKMETLGNEGVMVGEESVGTSLVEEEIEENCLVKEEEEGGEEGCIKGDGNRELLEKMIEDNEKMMQMMAQLFQRNEMQTKLLSSLSHRVDQLEKAFACEKSRKKKRRNTDAKHRETDPKNGCI